MNLFVRVQQASPCDRFGGGSCGRADRAAVVARGDRGDGVPGGPDGSADLAPARQSFVRAGCSFAARAVHALFTCHLVFLVRQFSGGRAHSPAGQ